MKKMSYNSPLGKMTALADENHLLGLWFNDQKYFGGSYEINTVKTGMNDILKRTFNWLDEYFAGKNPDPAVIPIKEKTTPFRSQVYQTLSTIPYGETTTYKELSDLLQNGSSTKKNLARAIGNAVGHNQILLLVPCHRVLGSDNSLTGYAGGLERKKALLELERK